MSTQPIWSRLQQAYLRPPKPRPVVSLINNPKARLRDLKRVTLPNEKARAPTVFNWIKPSVIWRASETREHKTKRRQEPHVREWRMPVTILAGKEARDKPMMPFVWMKMAHRDLKQVERAGGLEAKMISSASKNFSINGKLLRNALFHQLYRLRDEHESLRPLYTSPTEDSSRPSLAGQAKSTIGVQASTRKVLAIEAPRRSRKGSKAAA
ncbi:hypothetical protein DB88DRAFT_543554 [Papiliotrema laurentii]|uniref:Uncharacterized protein n=1 Tax=Papiliotrema laurentii TaxID=5418 RepID=A0AAD9L8E0_PAPLA|nr:hypothetical protein DB88DRAFT_543554 [Papiliotrema laurentii]